MTKDAQQDEFDAMRNIVSALEKFDIEHQQRILRYVQEKLGITTAAPAPQHRQPPPIDDRSPPPPVAPGTQTDIKSFIDTKAPRSDVQFAAAVAYFYRFEAPPGSRKESITTEDLQDACRKVGRERFQRPAQTFNNAHSQGLLDKAGERGSYALSTVGENLVAVALPSDGGGPPRRKTARKKTAKKKSAKGR